MVTHSVPIFVKYERYEKTIKIIENKHLCTSILTINDQNRASCMKS